MKTNYQPVSGDRVGPRFENMTGACLWVIAQPDENEWLVEAVAVPMEYPESPEIVGESFDGFCARKDREQAELDEQREVEASQLQDFKAWRQS